MDLDFISKMQQKQRGYSVKDVFEDAEKNIKDTKDVIIVAIDNDDFVSIYYSTGDTHKLIGHLEITKQAIINTL